MLATAWSFLATALASCWAISHGNTDFIRLDLSPIRGPGPPTTKRYPIRVPPPGIPPEQKPDVYCTDGQTPDDFYCDLRRFYGSNTWKERLAPDLYNFDLDYPDPRRKGVVCSTNFEKTNATVGSIFRLPFVSFNCKGGSGPETGLPTMRMSSVSEMRITTRRPNEYYYRCIFKFQNAGTIARSGGGRANGSGVVRFHYDQQTCISPVVIERQTTASPGGAPCEENGRRCRPRSE